MMEINLQLFGGGGSKSGLGKGGGGGAGNAPEYMYYTYGFRKKDGTAQYHTFKAKNKEAADKKADKYRDENLYRSRSGDAKVFTPEEYEAFKKKNKK